MFKAVLCIIPGLLLLLLLNFAGPQYLSAYLILGTIIVATYKNTSWNCSNNPGVIVIVIILFLLTILISVYKAQIDRSGGSATMGFLILPMFLFCFKDLTITKKYFNLIIIGCMITMIIQGTACLSQAINPHLFQKSGWIDYNLYSSLEFNRSFGFIQPANPLAFAIFMLPCVIIVNLYYLKEFYHLNQINLIFLTTSLTLGIYALLASGSRGPMVGFLFVYVCLVIFLLVYKSYQALIAHFLNLISALFVNYFAGHGSLWSERVLTITTDTSIDIRLIAWKALTNHFLDIPFWGVGPGLSNTSFFLQQYLPARVAILSSYNIFIEYYFQLGLVGLTLFCVILILSWRNTFYSNESSIFSFQQCFAISACAMLIAGMSESFIHHLQAQCIFSLFIALTFCKNTHVTLIHKKNNE